MIFKKIFSGKDKKDFTQKTKFIVQSFKRISIQNKNS